MDRVKVSHDELLKILINETSANLARDAGFLRGQIEIRRRSGTPNWDANCGVAAPFVVKVFATALDEVQKKYDLD